MSDEEKLNDVEEQTSKQPEEPPGLLEALDELFGQPEPIEMPATQDQTKKRSLLDELPPREFFDFIKDKLTEKQRQILLTAYENPHLTKYKLAHEVGVSKQYIFEVFRKYNRLYKDHKEEFEAWKSKGSVVEEEESEPERSPSKPKKSSTRKGGKGGSEGDEEKVTNAMYQMSKATTTFKEVDKTIAQLLGAEFHDAAIKKNVYARLGELLIYTLLQLGAIDRDQIVAYSQQLVDDPDALYFYVKEQLDAVIKITDPDTLQKIWMENANLRMKLMAYHATADMLSDALNYYAQVIRFLVSLLDKKQLEKFAMWVYMFEYLRRKRKAVKGVGGGSFAGAGVGNL